MKKIFVLSAVAMLLSSGCQKNDNKALLSQIAKLENRIDVLEKQVKAKPGMPSQPKEQTSAYKIPVDKSYVKGNKNAPITVVKFSDYQCPFCQKANAQFVDKIFEDSQLKDKVKVVFKHFPLSFHKNARPASKAALAAGEQGHDCFWKMTDKLYNGQRELTEDNFKKWAKEIKCKRGDASAAVALDADKFWKDYKNNETKYENMIKDDMRHGMEASVRGTPSFFVNGWKLPRRDIDALKKLIEGKKLLNL